MTPAAHADLLARLDERSMAHGEQLARIEQKVDKTNGRVTTLEAWKSKIVGAWFVVSFAGPVITGLVLRGLS